MQTLTDPILHDVARIIDRHPDLSPGYKQRLMMGLARLDDTLKLTTATVPEAEATKKVKR